MATYGSGSAPTSNTFNYDALVTATVANYRKTLIDNISKDNALFYKTYANKMWQSVSGGGLYITQPIRTGLGIMEPYDGYDELPLVNNHDMTMVQQEWRQEAAPIVISEKERKMNKSRIVNLLEERVASAEDGMKESFTKHLLQGSLAGSGDDIREPYTNMANGAKSIDPLPRWIQYDPTVNMLVGNLNQSTLSLWRNRTITSTATTGQGLLAEFLRMYNLTSKGPGGKVGLIWTDMVTWELLYQAYMEKYRATSKDNDMPFTNFNFFDTPVAWDEDIPDVAANGGKGALTAETTKGTAYFINYNDFKIMYEEETNFVATDWQKPINQDVKGKHILWMGNTFMNRRRKCGVIGNIARSLTFGS